MYFKLHLTIFFKTALNSEKKKQYLDCLSFILNYQLKRLPLSKT